MVPQAVKRIIERFWPELRQRHHVPQLARIERVCDMPQQSAKVSTAFRAYKAADVQLMHSTTKVKETPIFEQVPLAVSVNPHESGVICEPRPGMFCLIQYIDGVESAPVITHILPFNQSVPDVRSTDVGLLQSHRSKILGSNGNWSIETDGVVNTQAQTHNESAQFKQETYHQRDTQITGHDTTNTDGNSVKQVMGALKILVGEKALITAIDSILLGTKSKFEVKSHDNMTLETLKALHAKATELAKVEGATVWLGDNSVNAVKVLLDLISVVSELSNEVSKHTHPANPVKPVQSSKFDGYKADADELGSALEPITES